MASDTPVELGAFYDALMDDFNVDAGPAVQMHQLHELLHRAYEAGRAAAAPKVSWHAPEHSTCAESAEGCTVCDEIARAYELGRAEEREACARLAEQSGAFYICYSHVDHDNGVTRLGKPHPFAAVIRARKDAPQRAETLPNAYGSVQKVTRPDGPQKPAERHGGDA